MAVPSPSKSDLRAEGLKRRRDFARSLSPELRSDLEAKLARLVLPHLIEARIVAAYHPLRDEISPYPILTRLGHGKGHYDRALAHLREAGPVLAIGIGWESQISDAPLPRDEWDVPLD